MSAIKRQVGGDHYQAAAMQPIDLIRLLRLNFCEGNIVKYLYRAGRKGGKVGAIEDLGKVDHYIDFLAEQHDNDPAGFCYSHHGFKESIETFVDQNKMPSLYAHAMRIALTSSKPDQFRLAKSLVGLLRQAVENDLEVGE